MTGRTGRGRFGRGRYRPEPKYLRLPPRPLRFYRPNLLNSQFYILGRDINEREVSSASLESSNATTSVSPPSSIHNGQNSINCSSTTSCIQNLQDCQNSNEFLSSQKLSPRNAFIQFYARHKKSKFGKNKKVQNKLKEYSHSSHFFKTSANSKTQNILRSKIQFTTVYVGLRREND